MIIWKRFCRKPGALTGLNDNRVERIEQHRTRISRKALCDEVVLGLMASTDAPKG
jgi:hypothetical protein